MIFVHSWKEMEEDKKSTLYFPIKHLGTLVSKEGEESYSVSRTYALKKYYS